MRDREVLHEELVSILGSRNVYFQPPESIKMSYPAIVYSRENIDNTFADDRVYFQNRSYAITVIDSDPDSEIVDKVSQMKSCRHNRHYKSDNLNHDVFIINF